MKKKKQKEALNQKKQQEAAANAAADSLLFDEALQAGHFELVGPDDAYIESVVSFTLKYSGVTSNLSIQVHLSDAKLAEVLPDSATIQVPPPLPPLLHTSKKKKRTKMKTVQISVRVLAVGECTVLLTCHGKDLAQKTFECMETRTFLTLLSFNFTHSCYQHPLK
jgi:hypothetical protein